MNRREFLKTSAKLAALMGLSSSAIPQVARALEQLSGGAAPVLWLQGQSCSGCSVSLLNTTNPGPASLVTQHISLQFHTNLSTATGHTAMDVINKCIDKGDFILAVEGSIPAAMPEACVVGHEKMTDQVVRAAKAASAVIAVGSCASFGGIPAAESNPTGAMEVLEYLKQNGVNKPGIRLPGCPAHPDWVVGTLVHVLAFGLPELDAYARPTQFYGRLIHDQCPRFPDYERERFADSFADEGCLFKLGCMGANTHADCTTRMWNGGVNSCIHAGAPCIGCAGEGFARQASVPFHRKTELQVQGNSGDHERANG